MNILSTTRRLASITLPEIDNEGVSTKAAQGFLESAVVRAWGGFTRYAATGVWYDEKTKQRYEDDNLVYQVAMVDEPFNIQKLHEIAAEAGRMARQLAVAVTNPDGAFMVLDCDGAAVPSALEAAE